VGVAKRDKLGQITHRKNHNHQEVPSEKKVVGKEGRKKRGGKKKGAWKLDNTGNKKDGEGKSGAKKTGGKRGPPLWGGVSRKKKKSGVKNPNQNHAKRWGEGARHMGSVKKTQ